MMTQTIDQALYAMHMCQLRTPGLRALYRPGTPQSEALAALIAALERADRVLNGGDVEPEAARAA